MFSHFISGLVRMCLCAVAPLHIHYYVGCMKKNNILSKGPPAKMAQVTPYNIMYGVCIPLLSFWFGYFVMAVVGPTESV